MIKLMKNTFHNEEETKRKLCDFILKSEKLSMGDKCEEFERKFSDYQGRKYSVLFHSGSSANLALIQSLINLGKLKREDNVGFSALTWATNVMPLLQLGLNPVPIDVSLKNLNINSENLINSKKEIKTLFVTNLLGFCGDLNEIKKICDEKDIILIEDNCESLGSELGRKKLGNFGLASTFSFYVGHHLSTIEGGMVSTDDEELYQMLLMVRAHGWGRNLDERREKELMKKYHIKEFYENYTFYNLGYNLRPTEITGLIGCEQMAYLSENCKKRMENFLRFEKTTSQNSCFQKLEISHMSFISNFAYPLIFKDEETFERYKKKFSGKVEIRPIVGGSIPEQPFFIDLGGQIEDCPNAKKIHQFGFYIPNRDDLTEEEINTILNLLKED